MNGERGGPPVEAEPLRLQDTIGYNVVRVEDVTMDVTKFLEREFLRPLLTWLLPGALATAPWAAYLAKVENDIIHRNWKIDEATAITAFIAVALGVGLFIENLGSEVEDSLFDTMFENRAPGHQRIWRRYLQQSFKPEAEPIGQKYLRQVVLRFKFAASILVALPISWLGVCAYSTPPATTSSFASNWTVMSVIAGSVWTLSYWQSYETAWVLAKTRRTLLYSKPTPRSSVQTHSGGDVFVCVLIAAIALFAFCVFLSELPQVLKTPWLPIAPIGALVAANLCEKLLPIAIPLRIGGLCLLSLVGWTLWAPKFCALSKANEALCVAACGVLFVHAWIFVNIRDEVNTDV